MHQPGSFSTHLKSLVKNELEVARTSRLPPPRAAFSGQPAHHGQEVQPAPLLGHPTTCLETTTIIQELQQHPGAGEEAPSAEGPMGSLCTELGDDLGWKVPLEIIWPNPTPPRAGPAQVLLHLLQDFS